MVFLFTACESFDNYSSFVEEGVSIEFFINSLQYQKIEKYLEKDLIKKIYCNIEITPTIKGLYKEDLSYSNRYKVLWDKKIVTSEKEIPETFLETSICLYENNFQIVIEHKKSLTRNNEMLQ